VTRYDDLLAPLQVQMRLRGRTNGTDYLLLADGSLEQLGRIYSVSDIALRPEAAKRARLLAQAGPLAKVCLDAHRLLTTDASARTAQDCRAIVELLNDVLQAAGVLPRE